MTLSQIGTNLLYQSAAVLGTELIGLSNVFVNSNDTQMVKNIKGGLLWTTIDEILNMIQYGQSNVTNGNYYLLVDEAFFNTEVFTVLNISNVAERIYEVSDNLPFGTQINNAVGTGVLKVSASMLRLLLDQYWPSGPLSYISHVTKFWTG